MTYVSPMVRARATLARERRSVSRCQRHYALKMVRLSPTVIGDLEREEAPVHVFRWISSALSPTDHRRRTDLVIHLRRSIERPRNGWLGDQHFVAALGEWDRARNEVRLRGGIMPAVDQIELDVYRAAIEGVPKNPQTRSQDPETTEAAATESETTESSTEQIDDEIEEEPISSRRPLRGRDHVLRILSDAVRAALAAKDMEAAEAANDAITRLCGGR